MCFVSWSAAPASIETYVHNWFDLLFLFYFYFFRRIVTLVCFPAERLHQCSTVTSAAADTLSWTRLDLLTSCVSLSLWHARHNMTAQVFLLPWKKKKSACKVFCSDSGPMFNCKGALSQILHHHHHHVFILAGGGRVDYEAKWGEKQTHTHTHTHTGPSRHIFHAKKLCR